MWGLAFWVVYERERDENAWHQEVTVLSDDVVVKLFHSTMWQSFLGAHEPGAAALNLVSFGPKA